MKREFELLGRLQQFLLPKQLPQTKGVQFGAYYQPASDAGGDYYDVLPLADQVYGVVVADVSGHGAPAAMNMGIARSILHTVSLSQETSPAKTMFFLNKLLCRLLGENAYITMFYGILDMKQRTFTWSNAGHVPGYLKQPNAEAARPLGDPTNGPPLGWWPTAEFEEESITLESSDLVLLYTDGVIEAVNMHDAMFESQRLEACITQAKPADSDDTIQCILKELMEHIGENPLQDDVTLLSFSIS
ncbi:SpoIIE family protein phosphatase [bacterium]|nr:SpoIIE family protein phosphatase [bacterium]